MFLLVILCINLSSFPTFAQKEGDIRLISGRLEVFHSRVWGTVCDDYFDDIDAQVACRQIGHNSGISLGNTVDDGTGIIWLGDLNCTGNERALASCRHRGWDVKNCNHTEDVGIECLDLNEGDIRLTLGRLEILYSGIWGTVCDDNFDDFDAQVACRQLGYKDNDNWVSLFGLDISKLALERTAAEKSIHCDCRLHSDSLDLTYPEYFRHNSDCLVCVKTKAD